MRSSVFGKKFLALMLLVFCLCCINGLFAGEMNAEVNTHTSAESPGAMNHHQQQPGMFDINIGILVSQTINFFVLLFILRKFLFIPMSNIINERREHLGRIKLAAEQEHNKALEFKEEYEKHLANIEEEIYQIRQKAILEANSKTEEILEEARKKAEEIIEHGELELFIERQTAWARIREEVVQLTLMAAEKVVEESIDDDMHRRMIHDTIERLENNLPDHISR